MPSPSAPTAKEIMRRLLGKTVRCTLADGRVVVGEMNCLDKLKNFILLSVEETITKPDEAGVDCVVRRKLGMVMVPGKHLVKVEVYETDWATANEEPLSQP